MHRCFILLTLVAITYSKSVGIASKDVETTTKAILTTTSSGPPLPEKSETDAKLGPKRSVVYRMPVANKNEREERNKSLPKNLKTKRCKTLVGGDRVSLRNPNAGAESDAETRFSKTGRNEAENVLLKAIRDKMKAKDYNVGAMLKGTNVYEDDDYVCYCREKYNPSLGKGTAEDSTSKPQWLTRKNKPNKKEDNKRIQNENRLRGMSNYYNVGRQPFLSERLPTLYPSAPRYSPNFPFRQMKPILQYPYDGFERLPYIPYLYHGDPNVGVPDQTFVGQQPTKIDIPFNPNNERPNSIVGQEQPRNFYKNQETVGQTARPLNVGRGSSRPCHKKVSTSAMASPVTENALRNTGPHDYTSKTDEERLKINSGVDSSTSDPNLQSVHLGFQEGTTFSSTDVDETPRIGSENTEFENGNVVPENLNDETGKAKGLGEPENDHVGAPNPEISQDYETTGSGTLDYSEIKEVTTSSFTSKAYSDEIEQTDAYFDPSRFSSYDDSYITSVGPINTDQSYENDPKSGAKTFKNIPDGFTTEMAPGEVPKNLGTKNSETVGSELQSVDPEDDLQSPSKALGNIPEGGTAEMAPEEAALNVETKNSETVGPEFQSVDPEDDLQSPSKALGNIPEGFNPEMAPEELSPNLGMENSETVGSELHSVDPEGGLQSPSKALGNTPDGFNPEMPPEEAPSNVETKDSDNIGSDLESGDPEDSIKDSKDSILGEVDPYGNQAAVSTGDSNEDAKYDVESPKENSYESKTSSFDEDTAMIASVTPAEDVSTSGEDKNARVGSSWPESPETEDNGGPFRSDYEEGNFEREDNTDEGRPVGDGTIYSAESASDYPENVGAPLKSSDVEEPRDTLPFCDNTLLQNSIRAVINNFASEDPPEMDEETVGSTGDDLLKEIVDVPNLKGILSMPPIENTIVDKVKNLLTRVTGVARHRLENNWATNVIRNNLRHMMAAVPGSKHELPPMTVEERQFRNGKWETNLVTLEPNLTEEKPPTYLEKLQAGVRNLLRDPAVSLQAAKQPAIRNMIVQSVRKSFEPEKTSDDEAVDDEAVQNTLEKELSLMEMEDTGATTEDTTEGTDSFNMSDKDVQNILEIAKEEAGLDGDRNSEPSTLKSLAETDLANAETREISSKASISNSQVNVGRESFEGSNDENKRSGSSPDEQETERVGNPYREAICREEATNPEETSTRTATSSKLLVSSGGPLNDGFVGASRDLLPTEYIKLSSAETTTYPTVQENQSSLEVSREGNEETREFESTTRSMEEVSEGAENRSLSTETLSNAVAAGSGNQRGPSVEKISPEGEDTSTVDGVSTIKSDAKSTDLVGMERKASDVSPTHDFTYLGKISVKNNDPAEDLDGLQNSELYYVGDGVKLPLEIRKLDDGSYALSVSRKVCEHLLNEDCPCCVPISGHVVGTVKKAQGVKRTKRISKRESQRLIFAKEPDSADEGSQIFSMPVETFARRYNLSLNLKKLQAPWKFDEKIDGRSRTNFENKGDKAEDGLLRNSRRDNSRNGNYRYQASKQKRSNIENYRYQRNIDEGVNKRVEIAKSVLNWLREIILNANER